MQDSNLKEAFNITIIDFLKIFWYNIFCKVKEIKKYNFYILNEHHLKIIKIFVIIFIES